MIAFNNNPWLHTALSHCHLRMLTEQFFFSGLETAAFVKPICNVSSSGPTSVSIPSAGFYQKLITWDGSDSPALYCLIWRLKKKYIFQVLEWVLELFYSGINVPWTLSVWAPAKWEKDHCWIILRFPDHSTDPKLCQIFHTFYFIILFCFM